MRNLWVNIKDILILWFERPDPVTDIVPPEVIPAPKDTAIQVKTPPTMTNREKVYETAKGLLDQHIIPLTEEIGYGKFGCAASLNFVVKKAIGKEIGGGASTAMMLQALESNKSRFLEIGWNDIKPGDILMYGTGTSKKYPQAHGHVLVCGNTWCMSNSSEDGTWRANYSYVGVRAYFEKVMGFPPRVFRILG